MAAGVKLTPLIFALYLWFTGRRRAALVSLGTFAATIAAGFAGVPGASAQFWWGGAMFRKNGLQVLVNQSLYGTIDRLAGGASWVHVAWALAALVVGAGGLALAVAAARRGDQLLGLVVTGITGLLISPISWDHHWIFVLPALALAADPRWLRRAWARGAYILALLGPFLVYPDKVTTTAPGHTTPERLTRAGGVLHFAPQNATNTVEYHYHGWQLLAGNLYVVLGLAFLALVAVLTWLTHREREPVTHADTGLA